MKEQPENSGKKGGISTLGNKFGKMGEKAVLKVLHGTHKMKRYRMEVLVAFTRTV